MALHDVDGVAGAAAICPKETGAHGFAGDVEPKPIAVAGKPGDLHSYRWVSDSSVEGGRVSGSVTARGRLVQPGRGRWSRDWGGGTYFVDGEPVRADWIPRQTSARAGRVRPTTHDSCPEADPRLTFCLYPCLWGAAGRKKHRETVCARDSQATRSAALPTTGGRQDIALRRGSGDAPNGAGRSSFTPNGWCCRCMNSRSSAHSSSSQAGSPGLRSSPGRFGDADAADPFRLEATEAASESHCWFAL